jgi:glycosyltransferase involved in cell wall biosynthesis
MLHDITPLVLTYNEEANLGRTLAALGWARRIVLLDSGSTDDTLAIARRHAQVEVVTRPFDTHARQWNFGLQHVASGFVLTLDADYVLTPELVAELGTLRADAGPAWVAHFRYCVDGRPLRGSLLPPRTVLFRPGEGRYVDDGHTQRLVIPVVPVPLRAPILHDDRKPASRWIAAQHRYAMLEADKLRRLRWRELSVQDKARWLGLGPWLVVPYCLLLKGLVLDGRRGLEYCRQRFVAEWILFRKLLERRFAPRETA